MGIFVLWHPGMGIFILWSPGMGISNFWCPAMGISIHWSPGLGQSSSSGTQEWESPSWCVQGWESPIFSLQSRESPSSGTRDQLRIPRAALATPGSLEAPKAAWSTLGQREWGGIRESPRSFLPEPSRDVTGTPRHSPAPPPTFPRVPRGPKPLRRQRLHPLEFSPGAMAAPQPPERF